MPPPVDEATIREALAEVPDPEVPGVSIVDLGIVERIDVGPSRIRVELLPTFVGCPAMDLIRSAVEQRLAEFGRPIEAAFTFRVPWTTERISPAGRERLRVSGFAPPGEPGPVRLISLGVPGRSVPCPHCGSTRTVLENAFGPTQCRAIHYCTVCRQPFEAFKPV